MDTLDRRMIYKIAYDLDVRDIVRLMQCNKKLWRYFNDEIKPPRNIMGQPMALDYMSNKYFWIPKGIQLKIFKRNTDTIGNAKLRCISWAKQAKHHLHAQLYYCGDRNEEHAKIRNMSEAEAIKMVHEHRKAFKTYKEYEDSTAEFLATEPDGDSYGRAGTRAIPSIFDPRLGAEDDYGSISVARFENMDENREMLAEDYDDAIYKDFWNHLNAEWVESKQTEIDRNMEDKKKKYADKLKPGRYMNKDHKPRDNQGFNIIYFEPPPNNRGIDNGEPLEYIDVIYLAALDLQEYHRQKAQIERPADGNWGTAKVRKPMRKDGI